MTSPPVRTLVVHDDENARDLLESVARSRGHSVEGVADLGHAREKYVRDPHDLILLYGSVSGSMGGAASCRDLRHLPGSSLTVILLMAESAAGRALDEVLEAGADDVLPLPLTEESLEARLAVAERQVHRLRHQGREGPVLQDVLTGLASHFLLMQRIQNAIRRAARDPEHVFAVLELNLDAFGRVVRELGPKETDRILVAAGERIKECVRETDLVARVSGDRFTVLLDELHDLSDPTRVARRIHQTFEAPFRVDEEELQLTTGIGIALSLTGYQEAEQILGDAHNALRRAKVERPGTTRMFDPEMDAKAQDRIRMEDQIREALEEDRMELWYQPILSIPTGRIVGLEALARMRDHKGEFVPPGAFIPVAEASGLIERIGWWSLERAGRQLHEWQERFPSDPPLTVAVNVSTRQFSRTEVVEEIQARVVEGDLLPGSLHLEITETAVMANVEETIRALERIKELQVKLHVDDFGTGYSSLSYLCRLPVDTLKIDRAFIDGMSRSGDDVEVVRTILGLAHALGLDVVAEGVETEGQLKLLREMKCDLAQGHHFHRPMRAEDAAALLGRQAQ